MFLLMYKDIPVLKFKEFELSVLHKHLLPVSIQHLPEDYSMIQHFCKYGKPYYKDLCARAEKLLTLRDRLTSSVFNKSSVSEE